MFTTYEELLQAVEERRTDSLTLEIDLGNKYSQEYEAAKSELAQAKALGTLTGQAFLSDQVPELEEKVNKLKPESRSVWVRFKRLSLEEWSNLIKKAGLNPIDQYELVLPSTFIGVYGSDNFDTPPLSTDYKLMSSKGDQGILPGGSLHQVIQAFMNWQNSGGEVSIFPTK